MSHHIDVNFSVLPPGKEPLSKKLQKNSSDSASAKKKENKKLEIDNKQMEWRLNQLKKAMEKEKEERGSQDYIWKSGKTANLESHARNTLGHSVKTGSKSTKQAQSTVKPKVKVLKDEPLDIPKRKTHTKELMDSLMNNAPIVESQHKPETTANHETWISVALDPAKEEIMEMQSDQQGNFPLEYLSAIEPLAIGLYYKRWGRKRLILAVDGKIMKPKQGWGSEVYYPYIANVSPQRINGVVAPPKPTPKIPVQSNVMEKGGKLLEGTFDEEKSAQSFKNAIKEWRQKHMEEKRQSDSPIEMSVHAVQSDPAEIEINFSETSTLSYMERLLLKKHRASDIPPLPQSSDYTNCEDQGLADAIQLTEQELDDHERIRQIFTPQPSAIEVLEYQDQQSCLITEVPADYCWGDDAGHEMSSENCVVDESEEESSFLTPNPTVSRVSIQELTFEETEEKTIVDTQHKASTPKLTKKHFVDVPKSPSKPKSAVFPNTVHQCPQPCAKLPARPSSTSHPKDLSSETLPLTDESTVVGDNVVVPSSLLHAVSTLPVNPDAYYHSGLGEFFSQTAAETNAIDKADFDPLSGDLVTYNQGSEFWNPLRSVAIPTADSETEGMYFVKDTQMASDFQQDDLDMEKEDAKTLDALEWELASNTGNLTSDGRISRLIDEWSSEEEDLGIINDPGLGSGLSSPEVDHRSLASAVRQSTTWHEEENLLHDFEQMEQFMLADLNHETDSENDIID